MRRETEKPAILSAGRFYCDLIFTDLPRMPTLGTEVFSEGFGAHPGGGAFITAAHLAELGHPASLAVMLPPHPFSDLIVAELTASRVDLSMCIGLSPSAGPQLTVAMVEGGDRAFLTRRTGPPFPKIEKAQLARRGFRHMHVGELASLVADPGIIGLARANGMTISVDCSWDDALTAKEIRPLAGQIDVFLPNEAEHAALLQLDIGAALAPITVVKRGANGARAITETRTFDAPTKALDAIDTTGAGDAFNAGFLSAWLGGTDLRACVAAGNAQGGKAVQQRGGFRPDVRPATEVGLVGK